MANYINLQITYDNGSALSISGQASTEVMTITEQLVAQHRADATTQPAPAEVATDAP